MRIAALSDLHGFLPEIPRCDLVIVAGDVCPDGFGRFPAVERPDLQKSWFDAHVRPWLAEAHATDQVLTWGNHDWCGQACRFDDAHDAAGAWTAGLRILVDEDAHIPASGGGRSLSIWATPWSNQFGGWAFMKDPAELAAVYDGIPAGIDILVSHQPPFGYGDGVRRYASGGVEHVGSRELLATIARVRPKLVICGHIHSAYGRYEYQGVPIYNVSVVDEAYQLVQRATVIDMPGL